MRRKDREIVSHAEMEGILARAEYGVLSLCDKGKPYGVAVNFGYTDNAVFIHCAPDGRKLDIIRDNPAAGFTAVGETKMIRAEKACDWSSFYESVFIEGRAVIVDDPSGKAAGLNAIMRKYSGREYEFGAGDLNGIVIIRIDIETMTAKRKK
ncbi:MAG: pyridoxamine 5'-phosphate oxidase family protein [Brevinematales bacterium]|nr:pyridoxamine 5'-phosphate oxidase family protein [Brevinematales bacterium]